MELRERAPRIVRMDEENLAPLVSNEQDVDLSGCQQCADWSADCLTLCAGNWLGTGFEADLMLSSGEPPRDRLMIHACYVCAPACCLTVAAYLKKYASHRDVTFCSQCPAVLKKAAKTGVCSGLTCLCATLAVAASLPPMWH